ncbi:MAG: ATP-binding protein [Pelagimonas sp.]|uniref:hybrid sensor histidine kinase/response regulator n=1 Tax=Pelagimonas sp. TaxID=2073170 RepID=UPI003D6A7703
MLLLTLVVPLLSATWYSLNLQRNALNKAFRMEMNHMADMLANGMRDPVWNLIPEAGTGIIDSVMTDPRVISIEITSLAQDEFLTAERPPLSDAMPHSLRRDIVHDGDPIGNVVLVIDGAERDTIGGTSRDRIILISGLRLLLSFGIMLFILRVVRRLERNQVLQQANEDLSAEVDERRRAEKAMRESEERFRSVVDHSPSLLALKDLEGRFQLINRCYETSLGVKARNLIGKLPSDVFGPDLAARWSDGQKYVVKYEHPFEEEIVIPFADGAYHHLHLTRFPVFGSHGNLTGIGEVAIDMTAQRLAEDGLRQSQKLEAVGQLTGGIAHDFNNLLAVIMGNAEMLEDGDPEAQPALIAAIIKATDRGASLTQRLLAYSRKQALMPQIIDLGDLVLDMSEMLSRTLGEAIEVSIGVPPDLWTPLADAGQVENVLLNLALNSRDAMDGEGKLTIRCFNKHLDQDAIALNPDATLGDYVVLEVSDEGTGMTPEVQAHAFEPFYTTKEVGEGSGLGLSMIYGFAKQSGGHVSVETELGTGTTVRVFLPRAKGDLAPIAEIPKMISPRGAAELILVIEDNPDVGAFAVGMLKNIGYRVLSAANTIEAEAIMKREPNIDLVLSDVVLPGGESGPEFAHRASKIYPNFKVIFMSGYPAESIQNNSFFGPDQVLLHKPFQQYQLAKALRDALD